MKLGEMKNLANNQLLLRGVKGADGSMRLHIVTEFDSVDSCPAWVHVELEVSSDNPPKLNGHDWCYASNPDQKLQQVINDWKTYGDPSWMELKSCVFVEFEADQKKVIHEVNLTMVELLLIIFGQTPISETARNNQEIYFQELRRMIWELVLAFNLRAKII